MTLCNLQIHWLFISFLFSSFAQQLVFSLLVETRQINVPKCPPNKSAKMTRQNVLPWKSARSTRENDPPNLLARDPPFPAQNPQAEHGSPTFPPPTQLRQRSRVGGARSRPGPPVYIEQVLFLFFFTSHEWPHILVQHDTYIFYTERIEQSINVLL